MAGVPKKMARTLRDVGPRPTRVNASSGPYGAMFSMRRISPEVIWATREIVGPSLAA